MFWKDSAPISEKVYQVSKPIIIINRILGLFPMMVVKKGSELFLMWSPLYLFYSYALGIMLPVLTYRGLLKDIRSEKENSIKIKSHTDIYVAICDITVLELGVVFGIFVEICGRSKFFKYMKCLFEADTVLPPGTGKSARNASIRMIAILLIATFYITTADLFVHFKLNHTISKSYILECYLPFYVTYYVVLMNQYKFWYMGYGILRRLIHLNEKLEIANFKTKKIGRMIKRKVNTISEKVPDHNLETKGVGNIADMLNVNPRDAILPNLVQESTQGKDIFKMMTVYEKLCDAVSILNQLYGLTNAITILGILWHLIETPYLLISEISGSRKDLMSITVLSSWCLLHVGRLLLLAEPCYACLLEAQRTRDLVCKLLLLADADHQFKSKLQDFSILILHRKLEFTASGLTTIDRSLVTSVLGAITTYLVILLQFARSEQP